MSYTKTNWQDYPANTGVTAARMNNIENGVFNAIGICTSSTRPVSPYAGQRIWETDTSKEYTYTGSAWIQTGPPPRRLGYQERSTSADANQTSFAAIANLFTNSITFTADGVSRYAVEFWASAADTVGTARDLYMSLNLDGAETGRTNYYGDDRTYTTFYIKRYIIPSVGSHTVNWRAYSGSSVNFTVLRAGDGVGLNTPPMWMSVYGPDLT